MKSIALISILFIIHFTGIAQQTEQKDIVVLKNYDRIIGKIIEDHYPDYLIIESELLGKISLDYSQIKKINSYRASLPKEEVIYKKKKKKKQISTSVGTGLGYSFGGVGAKLQHNIFRKSGWGFSLGVGYNEYTVKPKNYAPRYQDSGVAFSFGVKFYPFKWFYLNINYLFNLGAMSKRDMHDIADLSLLLGADYLVYKSLGINAAFGISSYNNNFIISFDQTNVVDLNQLALDIGIYYKFKTKK